MLKRNIKKEGKIEERGERDNDRDLNRDAICKQVTSKGSQAWKIGLLFVGLSMICHDIFLHTQTTRNKIANETHLLLERKNVCVYVGVRY